MQRERYWELIEESRQGAANCDEHAENLTELLTKLVPGEILEYEAHDRHFRSTANRWDLWAIAYIVNGGCSDDGFVYFRGWLISQGKAYFEAALKDPQRAADNATVGNFDNECETFLYCAVEAYKRNTGKEMPYIKIPNDAEFKNIGPAGKEWDENDLEEMYPKLYKLFE